MGEPFGHEYAEFNADGILCRLRCQCCGETVASLEETPSRRFPGRTFTQLRYHANMAQRRIPLSDGSTTTLFLCKDCEGEDIHGQEEKVALQLRMGWQRGLEANRRPAGDIETMRARVKDLRPMKKAEIAARQKGPEEVPAPKELPKEDRHGG